jgi:hypothetical protein
MTHNTFTGGQVGAFTDAMKIKLNHNLPIVCTLPADQTWTSNVTQAVLSGFVTSQLKAGATYHFELALMTTQTTNGGLTLEFNTPDTLTLTSIAYITQEMTASVVANVVGTTATMGTKIIDNKTAAYILVNVKGSFVVAASGSLEFTAAQNTSHADTTTISAGSTLRLWCDTTDAA